MDESAIANTSFGPFLPSLPSGPPFDPHLPSLPSGPPFDAHLPSLPSDQPLDTYLPSLPPQTNHLDIEAIDSLADAVNKFNGGMVLVSHDFRCVCVCVNELYGQGRGRCGRGQGRTLERGRTAIVLVMREVQLG